jgi:hypothetical protein
MSISASTTSRLALMLAAAAIAATAAVPATAALDPLSSSDRIVLQEEARSGEEGATARTATLSTGDRIVLQENARLRSATGGDIALASGTPSGEGSRSHALWIGAVATLGLAALLAVALKAAGRRGRPARA